MFLFSALAFPASLCPFAEDSAFGLLFLVRYRWLP